MSSNYVDIKAFHNHISRHAQNSLIVQGAEQRVMEKLEEAALKGKYPESNMERLARLADINLLPVGSIPVLYAQITHRLGHDIDIVALYYNQGLLALDRLLPGDMVRHYTVSFHSGSRPPRFRKLGTTVTITPAIQRLTGSAGYPGETVSLEPHVMGLPGNAVIDRETYRAVVEYLVTLPTITKARKSSAIASWDLMTPNHDSNNRSRTRVEATTTEVISHVVDTLVDNRGGKIKINQDGLRIYSPQSATISMKSCLAVCTPAFWQINNGDADADALDTE